VEQLTWYILLKIAGEDRLAKELAENEGLKGDAVGIPSWINSVRFTPSGEWIFNAGKVYMAVMRFLLECGQDNDFRAQMEEYILNHGKYLTEFIVHSSGKERVFSTGLRYESNQKLEPGFNIYGKALLEVYMDRVHNRHNRGYSVEGLLSGQQRPSVHHRKTVLVLSDSINAQIDGFHGGDIVVKGGGWFHSLCEEMEKRGVDPKEYGVVVVHIGVNLSKKQLNYDICSQSWAELEYALKDVLLDNSATKVLFSAPIWNPKARHTESMARFIEGKIQKYDRSKVLLADEFSRGNADNPFVDRGDVNTELWGPFEKRTDTFHINLAGIVYLWRSWASVVPELQMVAYKPRMKRYVPEPETTQNSLFRAHSSY
jgi:hypothetical protein